MQFRNIISSATNGYCVYASLGSISAKLCNFHKHLISKEFAGFLIHPVVHSCTHESLITKASATPVRDG